MGVIKEVNIAKSMQSMAVGEVIVLPDKQVITIRTTASRLKGMGMEFVCNRQDDGAGVRVTRIA